MRLGLHITIALALTWASCAKTGAKESSVKDDSETATSAVVTPPPPPPSETGSVTTKTPTEENFLITYPTAFVNTATPLATWNESPELKDYDIIVSPDSGCKVPLQAYGDVTVHNQQLKPLPEGTYYICVYAIQRTAHLLEAKNSPFQFVVDLTPPVAPTIQDLAPGNSVNNATPTIAWDAIVSADEYNLSITTDAQCLVAVQEYEHLTTTSQALSALTDGSYYVCLNAADKAGNVTVATNNALPIVIDSRNAQIVNVTSTTPNGVYRVGAMIDISVVYNEVVTVDTTGGTPNLLLETGTTDRYASYISGSASDTLLFRYTVQAGDNSADLDVNTAANQLNLNGGSIVDLSLNAAGLDAPVGSEVGALSVNKNIVIDTMGPTVAQVSSPNANATYKLGDEIQIGVRFSEPVYVTNPGSVSLRLATGGAGRYAPYFAGSGTTTLYFNYQVQAGDTSADLATYATMPFTLTGGATVKDEVGNNAVVTLPGGANSLSGGKNLVVDGTVPTATSLSAVTANGTYKAGQVLTFNAVFSESVYVTNTASVKLELNTGLTRQASYASGSGTNTLAFSYTVASGDDTPDLDNTLNPIKLTGGATIKDMAGNNATISFAAGVIATGSNIVLDTTEPDIQSVTTPTANGVYRVGQSVTIELNFSEVVTVTNANNLKLKMETGATDTDAVYTSGSGSNKLVFTYTVAVSDTSGDLEVESMNALSLNGATIRDAAGNDAFLSVPNSSLSGSAAIVIDGEPPGAFSISGPTDPVYASSQSVSFTAAAGVLNYDVIVSTTNDCASHIGGSPFNAVNGAQNVTLNDGVYYACVTARDNAGNTTDASNQPYKFEVETSVVHVVFGASAPQRVRTVKHAAGGNTVTTVESWVGAEQLHAATGMALSTANDPWVSYANDSGDSLFNLSMASWNGAMFVTDAVQVSGGGENIGGFSSIALSSSDVSYIPHAYKGATTDVIVSSGTPGAWSHAVAASYAATATIVDSAIAMDHSDKAHVIFTYEDAGLFYLRYVNNVGGGWGAPMAVSTGGCSQYFQGSVAIDSGNNVHVAYLCATPAGACRAYHGKYTGAWTHQLLGTVQAAACDINAMGRTHKPSIVLNSANKAFITVFDEDADKLFLYSDVSGSFVGTELLNGKGWQAVIARDAFDKFYIVYRNAAAAGADIELITNNSGSWMGTVLDNSGTLTNIGDIVVEGVAGRSNRP